MLAQRYRTLYLLCRQFSSKDGGGGGAGGGSSPPNNGNKKKRKPPSGNVNSSLSSTLLLVNDSAPSSLQHAEVSVPIADSNGNGGGNGSNGGGNDERAARRVKRARLLNYWQHSDEYIDEHFYTGKAVLMVDREPLMCYTNGGCGPSPTGDRSGESDFLLDNAMSSKSLVVFDCLELRKKLNLYGLEVGVLNSALLDVVDGGNALKEGATDADASNKVDDDVPLFGCSLNVMCPPKESGIHVEDVKRELSQLLGGRFVNMRHAMLTISSEYQRNLLAKFQSLSRWYHVYRVCASCGNLLRMRSSKAFAECMSCSRHFYPTISPVVICLVRDISNEYCLLVRPRGQIPYLYTAVAGFCEVGESLDQTVRREVAEEVGVDCFNIRSLNSSQPWPMPHSSLMCAFTAVADRRHRVDVDINELEDAQWFSRHQVNEALRRVRGSDLRFLRPPQPSAANATAVSTPTDCNAFKFVPPVGAIAHQMLQSWVDKRF